MLDKPNQLKDKLDVICKSCCCLELSNYKRKLLLLDDVVVVR